MEPERAALVHLTSDTSSLGEGRRFVARTLRNWRVDEERIESVRLVANELLANAIVHAGSAPALSLEATGSDLLLRVADQSSSLPIVRRRGAPDQTGGRGLILVEALADGWGVDTNSSGKTVWASFNGAFS